MSHEAIVNATIRPEQPVDQKAIYDLTRRAFEPMPFAGGNEQDLINALREAGALVISLVAEQQGQVVGHIAFSPAFPSDRKAGWYALGPVAVEPSLQKQGIGRQLIAEGITLLEARQAQGCVLVGNIDYYKKFGFKPFPHLAPQGEPADNYMILPLHIRAPDVVVGFHPLFHDI
ncbi:GNAT family N-acetyltransferase [Parasphingorhabdus cellanae]|uniref:N-acetyltransferase n=1 Tax=Parasphingorhabdus cellanae TaxID=2806553 RepID=A0ABX7T3C8_9SPHN|nr:N-acetyltransferase [Parasphingorhabdus cellanae]QTD54582.1 N-acetyltransferase [Parasphingorhabdus cellanae]